MCLSPESMRTLAFGLKRNTKFFEAIICTKKTKFMVSVTCYHYTFETYFNGLCEQRGGSNTANDLKTMSE